MLLLGIGITTRCVGVGVDVLGDGVVVVNSGFDDFAGNCLVGYLAADHLSFY